MMPGIADRTEYWTLNTLLEGLVSTESLPALPVTDLAMDSKAISEGNLFLACAGTRSHGMNYAAMAVSNGAVAILLEETDDWSCSQLALAEKTLGVPVVMVKSLSAKASEIAARFYHQPSATMRVVGITGTNGKTSVSQLLARALSGDWRCGVLGTLGYGFPDQMKPASHTTPDAVVTQRELSALAEQQANAVAMEVSSHALHQRRVAAVSFHTAVFTNLSRDHLDYHGSMSAYAEAKSSLFRTPGLSLAVVNVDDSMGCDLATDLQGRVPVVACSALGAVFKRSEYYLTAEDVRMQPDGFTVQFDSSWGGGSFHSHLLGRFNVDNLLLVVAVLLSWGVPLDTAIRRIESLPTVAGRMELFGGGGLPAVIVDFAHTPDALEQVLRSLKPHVQGSLTCVFGCGGDRDRGKRPLMGKIAESYADRVVLTDDNPRSEDGDSIVQDILTGMQQIDLARVIRNRAAAIRQAITEARSGDMVLVAGKGHEDYQLVGDLKLPFSDIEQVQAVLQEMSG